MIEMRVVPKQKLDCRLSGRIAFPAYRVEYPERLPNEVALASFKSAIGEAGDVVGQTFVVATQLLVEVVLVDGKSAMPAFVECEHGVGAVMTRKAGALFQGVCGTLLDQGDRFRCRGADGFLRNVFCLANAAHEQGAERYDCWFKHALKIGAAIAAIKCRLVDLEKSGLPR